MEKFVGGSGRRGENKGKRIATAIVSALLFSFLSYKNEMTKPNVICSPYAKRKPAGQVSALAIAHFFSFSSATALGEWDEE